MRRRFGRRAGFVAGLVLALTPITVAISRHNNPDALLILCCVGALWALVRALEDGRTRWLVLSGALVGLGFETKMAVALMVVPGIVAAYLWVAPRGRLRAVRQLLAGGAAMVVAGGFWPVIVALTPASDRPWISGTADNSIWSLILGYNGLGRLTGQAGGPGGNAMGGGRAAARRDLRRRDRLAAPARQQHGRPGRLVPRLRARPGAAVLAASRLRRADPRTGWLIAVGGAFLTTAVAFSFAQGIFHPYYVSLLAPFTAALAGAGAAQLAAGDRVARILAPLAVVAGVLAEIKILGDNPGSLEWLPDALLAAGVAAIAALAFLPQRAIALAAAIGVLAIAPAVWSAQTLGHATSGTFPAGGPQTAGMGGGRAAEPLRRRRRRRAVAAACSAATPPRCGGPRLHARTRGRDDRRLLPVGRGHAGHRRRRGRRDRRLLRQRVRGDRAMARRRRARRQGPLGPDLRRRPRWHQRRAHRQPLRDGRRREFLQSGGFGQRAVRLPG